LNREVTLEIKVIKNDGNTQDILQNTNDHVTVLN